ncbi:MAG: hypothetical protein JWQ14_1661 [Adhaeribacter sp.]|nr:hypothetical protein [Adhaeribacter sp.]
MEENRIPFSIANLVVKSFSETLNPEEQQTLDRWLAADARHPKLLAMFREEQALAPELAFFSALDKNKAWQKIAARTTLPAREITLWQRVGVWKYAAALVLALGIALVLAPVKKQAISPQVATVKPKADKPRMEAGADKAKLTFADGTVLVLDNIAAGTVQEKNGIKIEKQEGQVIFQVAGHTAEPADISQNIISTPVGGQYLVVLPDGSKVWLNSASALQFPSAFSSRERAVSLTGEGYFEIAPRKNQPFRVTANQTTIEVLGTHFNLMAYPNEQATKTTLLEGSVKVSNGIATELIRPGQQASVTDQIKLQPVDVEEAIAWKKGLFHFNETDLETIARQLERWYNVDISFTGDLPVQHFTGIISRNTNIEQVLKMLCLSGDIDYKIKERRILLSAKKNN